MAVAGAVFPQSTQFPLVVDNLCQAAEMRTNREICVKTRPVRESGLPIWARPQRLRA